MSLINYSKYKISIDPKSKKIQGLQAGDIVRRQYFDGKNVIYSLMAVLDSGVDQLLDENDQTVDSPYFIGTLLDGDIPKSEEILDFARMTNLFNADRSGALYLTGSDSGAPYMRVIDKIGTQKSLCLPYSYWEKPNVSSKDNYSAIINSNGSTTYYKYLEGVYRVFELRKTSSYSSPSFKVTFEDTLQLQNVILVSFKIRNNSSSSTDKSYPFTFGYTDGTGNDASGTIEANNEWRYCLKLIRIDTASRNTKSLTINFPSSSSVNDYIQIGELNIIKLSDVSNFVDGNKATVGKINDIVDPVFGTLKGYGVYSQNLYATKNVGIAGTLTAGDENGFSSTFYAGKIRKNLFRNSVDFTISEATKIEDLSIPSRIGCANQLHTSSNNHIMYCRESGWCVLNKDKTVTFSIWIKSDTTGTVPIWQNTNKIGEFELTEGWQRYSITFTVKSTSSECYFQFQTSLPIYLCSPQLEYGEYATQYQPTDETLTEDDETYGFWACRGGIGGTIQNPLLRFDADGSIKSRDNNFFINADGSAYFKGQVEIGDGTTVEGTTLIKNGTINTDILNVREIFAKDIETETIVGSLLTFKKGTIGGWKITENSLTSETTEGKDHIELSTIGGIKTVVGTKVMWELKPDGTGQLAQEKIIWDKYGNLEIEGKIIADSGEIGGWIIDSESIYVGTKQTSNAYSSSGITLYSNGSNGAIRSKNFRIDTDGSAYFKGRIEATSGKIGNWTINTTNITNGNVILGSDGSITNGNYWRLESNGSGRLANGAIRWNENGVVTFDEDVKINATVTAETINALTLTLSKGSIGGWTIDSNAIYIGTKQSNNAYATSGITFHSSGAIRSTNFRIDTDGKAYFKGHIEASSGTFSGTLNAASGTFTGELSAATGSFSGEVTANSGSIGGWEINSIGISKGNMSMNILGIYNSDNWALYNGGSGYLAKRNILWDVDGNVTMTGSFTSKGESSYIHIANKNFMNTANTPFILFDSTTNVVPDTNEITDMDTSFIAKLNTTEYNGSILINNHESNIVMLATDILLNGMSVASLRKEFKIACDWIKSVQEYIGVNFTLPNGYIS